MPEFWLIADSFLVHFCLATELKKLILVQWASFKLYGKFINTGVIRIYKLVEIGGDGKNGGDLGGGDLEGASD